eukprot:Rmarinus@m.30054
MSLRGLSRGAVSSSVVSGMRDSPTKTSRGRGTVLAPGTDSYKVKESTAPLQEGKSLVLYDFSQVSTDGVMNMIASNEEYIAYGIRAGNIRVLNRHSDWKHLLRGHTSLISDICFCPEDKYMLATIAKDGKLIVFRVEPDLSANMLLEINEGNLRSVTWLPRKNLCVLENDGDLVIYDVVWDDNLRSTMTERRRFSVGSTPNWLSSALRKDIVYAGCEDGMVRVFDVLSGAVETFQPSGDIPVTMVSPLLDYLVTTDEGCKAITAWKNVDNTWTQTHQLSVKTGEGAVHASTAVLHGEPFLFLYNAGTLVVTIFHLNREGVFDYVSDRKVSTPIIAAVIAKLKPEGHESVFKGYDIAMHCMTRKSLVVIPLNHHELIPPPEQPTEPVDEVGVVLETSAGPDRPTSPVGGNELGSTTAGDGSGRRALGVEVGSRTHAPNVPSPLAARKRVEDLASTTSSGANTPLLTPAAPPNTPTMHGLDGEIPKMRDLMFATQQSVPPHPRTAESPGRTSPSQSPSASPTPKSPRGIPSPEEGILPTATRGKIPEHKKKTDGSGSPLINGSVGGDETDQPEGDTPPTELANTPSKFEGDELTGSALVNELLGRLNVLAQSQEQATGASLQEIHEQQMGALESRIKESEEAIMRRMEQQLGSRLDKLCDALKENSDREKVRAQHDRQSMTDRFSHALDLKFNAFEESFLSKLVKNQAFTDAVSKAVEAPVSKMMTNVQQQVRSAVESSLSKTLQNSVNKDVAPAIRRASEQATQSCIQSVSSSVSSSVAEAISRSRGQLQQSVTEAVKKPVLDAFQSAFRSQLVPACEAACQNMFTQVDASLNAGVTKKVDSSVAKLNQQADRLGQLARELVSHEEDVKKTIEAGNKQLLALLSKNARPSSTAKRTAQDTMVKIKALVDQNQYDEAYREALNASSLDVIVKTCQISNVKKVFDEESKLSQPVILSLLQQLAFDLSTEIELKLTWIREGLLALNPADSAVKQHVNAILDMIKGNLTRYAKEIEASKQSKNARMVAHLVLSIMK